MRNLENDSYTQMGSLEGETSQMFGLQCIIYQRGTPMSQSFIPIICPDCGENLSRISNNNPGVKCTQCPATFRLVKWSFK